MGAAAAAEADAGMQNGAESGMSVPQGWRE